MFPLVKKIIDGVPLVLIMIDCAVDRTSISNIESARFSTMSSSRAERAREDTAFRRQNHLLSNIKSANLDYHLDKEHNVEFQPGSSIMNDATPVEQSITFSNGHHKMGPSKTW
jgi:hypothetical protein